jgi:outer membrane protein OmpA-like peptidoglycan-associated protein
MKSKNLFLVILVITILLFLLCLWLNKKEINLFFDDLEQPRQERPTPLPIHKPTPKLKVKKSIVQVQNEIDAILAKEPITFLDNGYLLDNNIKTLDKIIFAIKEIDENIAIKVASHSDINGSSSYNRKLTQKRSNVISDYIKKRSGIKFINAIGYGREFLLSKDKNQTVKSRTKIYLIRIRDDF